jgi:hypothetical protein
MFETYRETSASTPSDWDGATEENTWEYVIRRRETSWLHSEICYGPAARSQASEIYFFYRLHPLLSLLDDPNIQLRQLDVIGRRTSRTQWQMTKVRKIWQLDSFEGGNHALELNNGRLYVPGFHRWLGSAFPSAFKLSKQLIWQPIHFNT